MSLNIPEALKLFYVQFDDSGESMDLNVQAFSHLEAAAQWQAYYEYDVEAFEGEYLQIQELTLSDKPGAVSWNGENKVFVTFSDTGEPRVIPPPPRPRF